ncbi:hypothetical protein INQ28_27125, partial [Escherichia coli]|nr:hypothetical protein [Escherichia coli]
GLIGLSTTITIPEIPYRYDLSVPIDIPITGTVVATTPNSFTIPGFQIRVLLGPAAVLVNEMIGPITIDVNQVIAIDSPIQQTISMVGTGGFGQIPIG